MAENRHGTRGGLRAVLPELVAARPAPAAHGDGDTLHRNGGGGIRLPPHGGIVGEPPFEEQPHGRPVQQRERIVHAGDTPSDQRILRESAHPFLLQKEVAQRLDQHSFAPTCLHRIGHAGQRQVLRSGQFLHQAADRKRATRCISTTSSFQTSRPLPTTT